MEVYHQVKLIFFFTVSKILTSVSFLFATTIETRALQAKSFNDPDSGIDVLVASDAVGMGLNL
jgi:hypothetical protein